MTKSEIAVLFFNVIAISILLSVVIDLNLLKNV